MVETDAQCRECGKKSKKMNCQIVGIFLYNLEENTSIKKYQKQILQKILLAGRNSTSKLNYKVIIYFSEIKTFLYAKCKYLLLIFYKHMRKKLHILS